MQPFFQVDLMNEDILSSTKSVVLKTRAKKAEAEKEDRIERLEKKIDVLLAKLNG